MARLTTATGQYLNAPDSAALRVPFPLAVAFWVKGPPQGSFKYLLSKLLLVGEHPSYGFSTNGSGDIRFLIGWGTVSGNVTVSPAIPEASVLDNNWHHVLGTYDGANLRIYLDGVEAGAGTPETRAVAYAALDLYLFTFDGAGLFAAACALADVTLLSAVPDTDQRAALAAAYSPRIMLPAAVEAQWPLVGRYSPEIDPVGGQDLTVVSVDVADQPRLILPPGTAARLSAAPAGPEPPEPPEPSVPSNIVTGNFINIITGIGACVVSGLAADTATGAPCRTCLAIGGSIAADGCCTCTDGGNGQLAVTVTQIYPSATFPQPANDDGRQSRCGVAFLVAEVHVQIHRCVHTSDEAGNPPTCEQLLADAIMWHADAAAIRKAVGCCVSDMKAARTIRDFTVGATTALGEEGGCAGSDLQLLVAITNCLCAR